MMLLCIGLSYSLYLNINSSGNHYTLELRVLRVLSPMNDGMHILFNVPETICYRKKGIKGKKVLS